MDIPKFDPAAMDRRALCLIVGKRATGKSTLVRDLVARCPVAGIEVLDCTDDAAAAALATRTPGPLALEDWAFDPALRARARAALADARRRGLFAIATVTHPGEAASLPRSDYVFALRETHPRNRERLWARWFGAAFPRLREFEAALDACTEDYQCLVLDSSGPGPARVAWYRAEPEDRPAAPATPAR